MISRTPADHRLLVVGQVSSQQVGVGRGATGVEHGQQQTTLQYEGLRVPRRSQPGEPTLQNVKRE